MKRFQRTLKTIAAVAVVGAIDAITHSDDIASLEGITRTAAIGALGGILYWMRSPKDVTEITLMPPYPLGHGKPPARPSPQDPPKSDR